MIKWIKKEYHSLRRRYRMNEKFDADLKMYQKLCDKFGGFAVTELFPKKEDFFDSAGGIIDSHYFFQDMYMARKVLENGNKINHFDIGSRIDGFISHMLASPSVESLTMIDIRPFPFYVDRLKFIQADATSLEEIADESLPALSCLHAVEHFGLGRYGDPVDPNACFKAMKSFQRVVSSGGRLYLSVPVTNRDECHFNAHRIFSPQTVLNQFDKMKLIEFSYIHDKRIITYTGKDAIDGIRNNMFDFSAYDCGMFIFEKI